jgi:hypothetical protein
VQIPFLSNRNNQVQPSMHVNPPPQAGPTPTYQSQPVNYGANPYGSPSYN